MRPGHTALCPSSLPLSPGGEARGDALGQLIHVSRTDPFVGRSLYQLKDPDAARGFWGPSDDVHMEVLEPFLLTEKEHVRL